jgi:NADH-quinone oxidoreductase subunit A
MLVYFAAVVLMVAGMLALSHLLGERHRDRARGEPYESGILSTGTARVRLSVKFYRMAMFFVVFDVEAVFIFAWAVAFREVGWAGYIEMVVFVATLVVGLLYLWREGALDWGPSGRRRSPTSSEPRRHRRPGDGPGASLR